MRKIIFGITLLLVFLAATSINATMISPTAVIGNTLGVLGPGFEVENLINQSGLSIGFTSGVTDFDSYLALNPEHAWPSFSGNGGFASHDNLIPMVITGDIDFDFGSEVTLTRLALWNDGDAQAVGSFTVFVSNDSGFGSTTNLGTFVAAEDPIPIYAQVFDINDGSGRYVRIRINSTSRLANLVNFGEVAFDSSSAPVPEPSTMLLLGSGLIGLLGFRRRFKK